MPKIFGQEARFDRKISAVIMLIVAFHTVVFRLSRSCASLLKYPKQAVEIWIESQERFMHLHIFIAADIPPDALLSSLFVGLHSFT